MRFLVFGAGSLGSLLAARLAEKHAVGLVGRREHVAAIRARGLRVEGRTECVREVDAAESVEGLSPGLQPDAVLVTVKAYDTARALEALRPYHHDAAFVSLQNGLGNEELLAKHARRVIGAVINQGVTFVEPGVVFHAGEGETELGAFPGTRARRADAEAIATAFVDAGLPARVVEDVRERIWNKVVLNAAVNPLTGLLGRRTGAILAEAPLRDAVALVVEESVGIARAENVALSSETVLDTIWNVARATSENKSSMLQDLERGRKTEIDAINGALVERAKRHAIACPANELLTLLVRAAESKGKR